MAEGGPHVEGDDREARRVEVAQHVKVWLRAEGCKRRYPVACPLRQDARWAHLHLVLGVRGKRERERDRDREREREAGKGRGPVAYGLEFRVEVSGPRAEGGGGKAPWPSGLPPAPGCTLGSPAFGG